MKQIIVEDNDINASFQNETSFNAKMGVDQIVKTGDKFFEFIQSIPSQKWEIAHPLKKFPAVMVVDSAGSVVVGDITYVDDSTIIILFQAAFAGKAYLN